MKNWLTNVVVGKILNSRKFVYGLTGVIVPILMTNFGWGADVAETVWKTACVLILGQGIADTKK